MIKNILPEIKNRISPLVFKDKAVEKTKIMAMIEAARWAPSCFNNQPWKYILVDKKDKNRSKVEDALNFGNGWAKKAPYIVIVGGKPKDDCQTNNIDYYLYDAGQSVMSFAMEAVHQGLAVHQMAGFDGQKIKGAVDFPNGYNVIVVMAVGYRDNIKKIWDKLEYKIKDKLSAPRTRKKIEENFFFGKYKNK